MKKRTILLARIERLERQRQPKTRLGHRIVFSIGSLPDDKIASFNDNINRECIRQAGEPLQAFINRAFAVTGAHSIYASYEAATAALEDETVSGCHSAPSQA